MEQPPKRSALVHMFSLGGLFVLLLIPSFLVDSLVREREGRRNSVLEELRSKWGRHQKVVGPILSVPVSRPHTAKDGTVHMSKQSVQLLPEVLKVEANLQPELRSRGIYQAVLYGADVSLSSEFDLSIVEAWRREGWSADWTRASLALGISDLKGIASEVVFNVDGRSVQVGSGTGLGGTVSTGMQAALGEWGQSFAGKRRLSAEARFRLNGGGELIFAAAGQTSSIHMQGAWGTPSFVGEFLPMERRVEGNRFESQWRISGLNRSLPQSWTGDAPSFDGSQAGVRLLMPIDEYQQALRATKYAVLFIAVMMFAFFIIEVMSGIFLHPIQYAFIALALLVFYILLLSLSEHVAFMIAYGLAASAVVALVGFYLRSAFRRPSHVLGATALLASLYAYLYVLVQEEDYALLLGSIGLFVLLAVMMFVTRRIDWYAVGRAERSL